MKTRVRAFIPIILISAFFVLSGCPVRSDGDNGGGNGGVSKAPAVFWGVMKKGSIIVNDVTFGAAGAQIEHDDSPAGEALLQAGMNVKVRGRLNDDGITGVVTKIKSECELQGTVTATGLDSITLLGQQVFTDDRTVFSNVANLQEIAAGHWVDVHGIRDQLDRLLATRIEVRLSGSGPAIDRLKGFVEAPFTGGNPPALSFKLRGLTITTTQGTLISPAGSTINPGDPVEVHGFLSGTTFTAGRVDREDLEDADFLPQESERYKGDGFISGYTGPDAVFQVNAKPVRLNAGTRFDGGSAADLTNNMRVVVEGIKTGGVLDVEKIRIDESETVHIEANADGSGRADVLGKTVVVTGFTELSNLPGGVAGIASGQGLKLRGCRDQGGAVIARQIVGLDQPIDSSKVLIQGMVESVSAPTRSFVVLGITVEAPGAEDRFFSQLTPDRSIVEAKGSFTAGPPPHLTASQVAAK